jgi:hypothetical protein
MPKKTTKRRPSPQATLDDLRRRADALPARAPQVREEQPPQEQEPALRSS